MQARFKPKKDPPPDLRPKAKHHSDEKPTPPRICRADDVAGRVYEVQPSLHMIDGMANWNMWRVLSPESRFKYGDVHVEDLSRTVPSKSSKRDDNKRQLKEWDGAAAAGGGGVAAAAAAAVAAAATPPPPPPPPPPATKGYESDGHVKEEAKEQDSAENVASAGQNDGNEGDQQPNHRLTLIVIDNLMEEGECNRFLVELASSGQSLIDVAQLYADETRKGKRSLSLHPLFTSEIWRRLQTTPACKAALDGVDATPLGFGVLGGGWALDGINPAVRVNVYDQPESVCFAPHRDAQFCPNADRRSLLSLLVYANDGFEQGETKFYFPKASGGCDQQHAVMGE